MQKMCKVMSLFIAVLLISMMHESSVFAINIGNVETISKIENETSGFSENEHGEIIKYGNCGSEYDAQYRLYKDGTLYVYGSRRNIVSCSSLRSYQITSVYIEDGISEINDEAFKNFVHLMNVKIPNSVKNIGIACFCGCEKLKEIELPKEIKYIEHSMFSGCSSLTTIRTSGMIEEIGSNSFYGCKNLEDIEGLMTCSSIGEYAFYGCNSLKKVVIPYNVKKIGTRAFSNCSGLETVEIFGPALVIQGTTGSYTYIECEFSECENLKNVILYYGSTKLEGTFYGCTNLEIIELPSSINKISKDTFYACGKLIIRCYEGSYAETFANENNIPIDLIHVHKYENVITKKPTCTETGIRTYICNCNEEYTEEIPAIGHEIIIDPAVEPTETETGRTEGRHCSVCGEILKKQEIIPATGKTENQTVPKVEIKNTFKACKEKPLELSINATQDDNFTFECEDNCKFKSEYYGYSSVISPFYIEYKKIYMLTFENSGEHIVSILKNGILIENIKVIVSDSHDYDDGKIEKIATCEKEGQKKYTCKVCGDSFAESIPATGHTSGIWKVSKKSTIFKSGKETILCTICKKILQERDIVKLKSNVKISKTKLQLKKGKTYQLKVKKKSKGDKILKWEKSNKKIVNINKRTGKIKALKKGKVTITLTMKSGCKAKCKVTVK